MVRESIQDVTILLNMDMLYHIEHKSSYGNNYFYLPFKVEVDGKVCDVLFEDNDDSGDICSNMYSIGYFEGDEFIREICFGYSEDGELCFDSITPRVLL